MDKIGNGRLAQLVEQLTLNQRVVGSSPTASTFSPSMSTLSLFGWLVGAALSALGAAMLWYRRKAHRWLEAFPRHRAAAVVLTLVNVIWVAWLLYHTPLGRFDWIKPFLILLAPAVFFAVITYMDELLAPRMWGGFLLLLAAPVLDAARWHDSALRLVLTVTVYAWVVWGMTIMLSPYRFRHATEWLFGAALRERVVAIGCFSLGLGLIALASTVY